MDPPTDTPSSRVVALLEPRLNASVVSSPSPCFQTSVWKKCPFTRILNIGSIKCHKNSSSSAAMTRFAMPDQPGYVLRGTKRSKVSSISMRPADVRYPMGLVHLSRASSSDAWGSRFFRQDWPPQWGEYKCGRRDSVENQVMGSVDFAGNLWHMLIPFLSFLPRLIQKCSLLKMLERIASLCLAEINET